MSRYKMYMLYVVLYMCMYNNSSTMYVSMYLCMDKSVQHRNNNNNNNNNSMNM